ncbi:hypothetical protein, conserved [Leishmania tarentolae]|uniref:Uncharacterized protein n=1 Tax=Leishmania tarentolae TaxID=5689 RepID=A0A640KHB3_LEITA|nr:hypothetical protein, conserved [Leishmania tarentolae]
MLACACVICVVLYTPPFILVFVAGIQQGVFRAQHAAPDCPAAQHVPHAVRRSTAHIGHPHRAEVVGRAGANGEAQGHVLHHGHRSAAAAPHCGHPERPEALPHVQAAATCRRHHRVQALTQRTAHHVVPAYPVSGIPSAAPLRAPHVGPAAHVPRQHNQDSGQGRRRLRRI